MNEHTAPRLAWSLAALAVVLTGFELLLTTFLPQTIDPFFPRPYQVVVNVQLLLAGLAFPTVGALIAAHQPRSPIGWLMYAGGLTEIVRATGQTYARYALMVQPRALPVAMPVLWLAQLLWALSEGLFVFVFLLFPSGRLPSPRWRPVAWLTASIMLLTLPVAALRPWPELPIHNPTALEGPLGESLPHVLAVLFQLELTLSAVVTLSLLWRFRQAHGLERQQLKWVVSAKVLAVIVTFAFWLFGGWLRMASLGPWAYLAILLYSLAFTVPIAIGIAILRYRLYAIDILIRSTLIYSLLTTTLALVYFGSVVLLQSPVRGLAGPGQHQWVTVLSTLAIAVLFTPLRRQVQAVIDRRFYRRRYNAAKVLDELAILVRNETDLDRIAAQLLAAVQETMQPTQLSLWLRAAQEEGKSSQKEG
jgi:hypothetical protein